jgi:hypothetical protein
MTQKDYSEPALFKFFDYVKSKGLLKTATSTSRKIAAQKILSVLDAAEKQDLRQLNREQVFERFTNKMGTGFTPESLVTYKSRFNSALDDFMRWVENPAGFSPGLASRGARRQQEDGVKSGKKQKSRTAQIVQIDPNSEIRLLPAPIVFPVPLRPGVVVQLHNIPTDLSQDEAKRISAVVLALASPVPQGK